MALLLYYFKLYFNLIPGYMILRVQH